MKKPARRQPCNEHDCPPAWHSGKWTEVIIKALKILAAHGCKFIVSHNYIVTYCMLFKSFI